MLFLLTGDVQIGKTRWLEGLIAALADVGVGAAGVVAPGQWVPSTGPEADANGYEKLGIDNLLLPEGGRLSPAGGIWPMRKEASTKAVKRRGRNWHGISSMMQLRR